MKYPNRLLNVLALVLLPLAFRPLAAQSGYPAQDPAQSPYPPQPENSAPYAQDPSQDLSDNYGEPIPNYSEPAAAPVQQPLTASQLEQLLAPVALYPDSLLAQVLAASTYPAEVSAADSWLNSMAGASPDQIVAGANAQASWDPSVKALTAFPQVLGMLAQNLQWTTSLGNAYYNQPQDVMQTVQVLRQRAEEAGNLQSTPQEEVSEDQGAIELAPPDPEVVYVPTYDPWQVYGVPIAPYPDYYVAGGFYGDAPIFYGAGIGIAAWEAAPFGWWNWGFNWFGGVILFGHDCWWSHSHEVHDWGYRYGGPRAPYSPVLAHFGNGNVGGHYGYRTGPVPVRPGQRIAGGGFGTGINRPGQPIGRPQPPFGRSNQPTPVRPPQQGFGRPSLPPQQGFVHAPTNPARPPYSGYRPQPFAGQPAPYRPQNYAGLPSRPSYGSMPGYGYRPSAPQQPYRPQSPLAHSSPYQGQGNGFANYGGRSYGGGWPGGRSYTEPRMPSGGRSFGGFSGGSSGSFHSSAPSGGSFGGGHSFGGGGGFGGGHSFGGGGGFSGAGHSSGGGFSGGGGHSSGGGHGRR